MIGLENPLHIAMILVVLLLVFGAKRLPEMGKSLGEGLRGFKHSLTNEPPAQLTADATARAEEPAKAAYSPSGPNAS
jgi:sec-independent protein translocase protein TatA